MILHKPLIIGIASLAILFSGTVIMVKAMPDTGFANYLTTQLTAKKTDDQDKAVDRIGIFPPGFKNEAVLVLQSYQSVLGNDAVHLLNYNGYFLVVPDILITDLQDVYTQIDTQIAIGIQNQPSLDRQNEDKLAITNIFGATDISYETAAGAYADNKGYQYSVTDGAVTNKQISVTPTAHDVWAKQHPYLMGSEAEAKAPQPNLTIIQAQTLADQLIQRRWPDQAVAMQATRSLEVQTKVKVGFSYRIPNTQQSVRVLIDRVASEIIGYNQDL